MAIYRIASTFNANINNWRAEKIYRQSSMSFTDRDSMVGLKEEQGIELVNTTVDFSYLFSLLRRITFVQVR